MTLPWLVVEVLGKVEAFGNTAVVFLSGSSILGAAFLLAWAAETAEKDVPRSFALAVLAVLAVAPEYAVDALYAWKAGAAPGTAASGRAAELAVANMTGANRILIGLGWSVVALYSIYVIHRGSGDSSVRRSDGYLSDFLILNPDVNLEVVFLFLATIFAFFVPLNGALDALDMAVLVGLYVAYILLAVRSPHAEEFTVGVPAYLRGLEWRLRAPVVVGLFAYSGVLILLAVEPFATGLEHMGLMLGVSPFLMIQWVAPLASESPEMIVAAYLVNKARSTASFNALISSKLNQWTLLIGTLVLVYSASLGSYGELPLNLKQTGEIWLTAAQSFFAIVLLSDFRISVREALSLLVLFSVQLHPAFHHYEALVGFSLIYVSLGVAVVAIRRDELRRLVGRFYVDHFRGRKNW